MSNTITVQNAPRDIDGLSKINRTIRYRLGLSLQMWGGDQQAEEAFLAMDDANQAQALAVALQSFDAQGGNGATGPAQPAPQAMAQPAPQPMQAPQPMAAPQPMQQAPQPMQQPMQQPAPQQPMQHPQAPQQVVRTPSTQSDPSNAGAVQQAPQAPQQPMQAPQQPQQPQPATPQGGAGEALLGGIRQIQNQLANLHKYTDEQVAGAGDLEEVKEILLGVARMQETVGSMVLLLMENQLELQRPAIIKMVVNEKKQGSLGNLLQQAGEAQGKD